VIHSIAQEVKGLKKVDVMSITFI